MAATPVTGRYDLAQLKDFDDSKEGVKGLVDAGITEIPNFFVHSQENLNFPPRALQTSTDIPCIDMQGADQKGSVRRREVVEEMGLAASRWGVFRIVNHGVPIDSMDAMLQATRRFHEQPKEAKKEFYYSYDGFTEMVRFNSHVPLRDFDPACWRDQLVCQFFDDTLDPQLIPQVCREALCDYATHMTKLKDTMAELLSEAMGLTSDYLLKLECMKTKSLALIYYPKCPQPDRTLGSPRHSDPSFVTVLLPDNNIGGLQVLHDNCWVDVSPVHGSLIVNMGDYMQIITNDKFKSVEHRVVSQYIGPRVSVGCFHTASSKAMKKAFGPIKEIVSKEGPAVYREFTFQEYMANYMINGHTTSALPHFKL